MRKTISVDFETFYTTDKENPYGIKELGADRYIRDPRFEPYLVSVYDGKEAWAGELKNFNEKALEGQDLLSHNAKFDSSVKERLEELGTWPKINVASWHCTANLTMYLCMRRDLSRAAEFLLGIAADKSYREDADGKHWPDIVAAGKAEKVLEAGRVDAVRCHQFFTKFGHLWPERERRISDLTIRQCKRGVQIDTERLSRYKLAAQTALIQAESVLPWMKHGKKPTSPKAVAEECRKVNIPPPPVKSRDGEEVYDEWAALYAPKYQWVKAYTDYRVINKFIATLETIESRLRPDGTFSFELLYFGAHTGRWAGAGGFNMQNMRKDPLFIDIHGWLVTDEAMLKEISSCYAKQEHLPHQDRKPPEFVAHVLDIRALFCARPGRKLVMSDLSQIEPRVLAWLVNDTKMLASMASGNSPYQAHAVATMNWDALKDLKKSDKKLYALAKARVLGLGFGCGWNKFITVAQVMAGLDITEDDPEFVQAVGPGPDHAPLFEKDGTPKMVSGYGHVSRIIVAEYRAQNPLITGLWKTLDESFKDSVGTDFSIKLPSGRSLRYPEVRREQKSVADEEHPGRFKRKWVTTALAFDQKRNGVVRKPFYGGLLTENLVQATARDVFGEHLITLDETSGVDVLWSVHDEAINEVDQGVTKKDIEHIMGQCPAWIPGLPVAAEAVEAPHYLK